MVIKTGFNAQYKFSKRVGGVIGLISFATSVEIEDSIEKQEISYDYDGLFVGLHLVF